MTPEKAAILQLKHSIDRHWKIRGGALGEGDKEQVKALFVSTLLNEQNGQVATQAAVIASKIIRKVIFSRLLDNKID